MILGAVYFVVTLILQVLALSDHWNGPAAVTLWNNPSVQAVYTAQKLLAVIFYYTYKRTVYCLSDKKLYRYSFWMESHNQ